MSARDESKKPVDNAFQQQKLKAWQPLLTPAWVIGTFFVVGCLFLPIGGLCLWASNSVVEVSYRYDETISTTNGEVNITIPADMDRPIFFYYKLTNFYQNHRRYVKSRSDEQLKGTVDAALGSCEPLEEGSDDKKLYPCGLIAQSMFNDTFYAAVNGNRLTGNNWNGVGIAWDSDVDGKFKLRTSLEADETTMGPAGRNVWTENNNEDFIVWMRTAGLPTFKKLYRKIEDMDLAKGDILTINVTNVFPVDDFDGEKHFVLSTTSALGGKNDFLAYSYLITGSLCLLLAVVFFIKNRVSPRPLGDMHYFKWPGTTGKR